MAGGAMSVIGATFVVLLAFAAMLTLEGHTNARTTTIAEAAVSRDVSPTTAGVHEPACALPREQLARYRRDATETEWSVQPAGHLSDAATTPLARMDALLAARQPTATADGTY